MSPVPPVSTSQLLKVGSGAIPRIIFPVCLVIVLEQIYLLREYCFLVYQCPIAVSFLLYGVHITFTDFYPQDKISSLEGIPSLVSLSDTPAFAANS